MAKMRWDRATPQRQTTLWPSKLERAADRLLGIKQEKEGQRVLRAKGQKAAKHAPSTGGKKPAVFLPRRRPISPPTPSESDVCDIWVTWGADSPWNPTPGERCVKNITSMVEAKRLGLR